jgi:hypothetical protein
MEGFLKYLDDWKASVDNRENFTPAQKQRMLLSSQTIEGLKITGELSILVVISKPINRLFVQFTRFWKWLRVCCPYLGYSSF